MKTEILKKIDALRNPDIRVKQFHKYLDEIEHYVKMCNTPKKYATSQTTINIKWLQKRIAEDVTNGKCDGRVFTKVNSYIHEYEVQGGE